MSRPRRPRAWTSRDTSAALVVRYLSVTPLTGSYVLRTRTPRGGLGAASCPAATRAAFLFSRHSTRFIAYLVVMRVCPCGQRRLVLGLRLVCRGGARGGSAVARGDSLWLAWRGGGGWTARAIPGSSQRWAWWLHRREGGLVSRRVNGGHDQGAVSGSLDGGRNSMAKCHPQSCRFLVGLCGGAGRLREAPPLHH